MGILSALAARLRALEDRLLTRLHRHSWTWTAHNPFGVAFEHRCLGCGVYRHRRLEVWKDTPWLEGPHPEAERLRAAGLSKNY